MIELEHISKSYPGGYRALNDISCTITQGELVYLTGHSGAGKTTLLKIISALEAPTSGIVRIGGRDISHMNPKALPYIRRNFGLVFQDHKLLYDRNVFENIALPLHIKGITGQEASKRVHAALSKVDLLGKEKAMPITLSGGEQQRLAIARSVVGTPSVLIADEPTANLDEIYTLEIMKIFYAFHRAGATILIATHDIHSISLAEGRIINLSHGGLVAS